MKDKSVAVVMGGPSAEHEVSLHSGTAVLEALTSLGYRAREIRWNKEGDDIAAKLKGIEVVWNALHGPYGEDGAIQGLCECLGIAYTGSDIAASAIAMDKALSKVFFDRARLRVPAVYDRAQDAELPVVVKPACEGSSVGVTIVRDSSQLAEAIADATRPGHPAIIEQFIDGIEASIGVLDGKALGVVEIRPATEFYDYEAKYLRDDTQYLVPPPDLPEKVLKELQELSLKAHDALGCGSYSRVDFMVDRDTHAPYLIEVNTLPGMTGTSLLPKSSADLGIGFPELCERILLGAIQPRSRARARTRG